MASQDDKDPLMGLFSTRRSGATAGGPGNVNDRKTIGQSSAPSQAGPANEIQAVRAQANTPGQQRVDGPNQVAANKGPIAASLKQAELSALASTVLREARRELGSDYGLQQAQAAGMAINESDVVEAVDRVLRKRSENLDDIERANVIIHLQKDLMGWGVLQPLIDNKEVTDIHVYDYRTVVLQRGKMSETTGLHWPSHSAYVSFIDRLLLRMGRSLNTQQHTVDAALPNGVRLCAVHESVCGQRGPLLSVRVPRMGEIKLENLVSYQVAPPLIVNYLASIVRSGQATIMVAGETGTGKTTVIKCLGTQFGVHESIVAVEDTPELNFDHPYFRSLISRSPNAEGIGEVTLQEHIKTTLRMTPTRVILGEMRTPPSAEAFLESAQTGHIGMSTIHARNARETLIRLESLLGRAQKAVPVEIIRQQIALAVDLVVWMFREKVNGKPRIGEIIEVGHYVEGAIQVRPMFTLIQTGDRPVWRLDSWTSAFDEVLNADQLYLGDCPQEFSFGPLPSGTQKRR